jgi:hypothetical protein
MSQNWLVVGSTGTTDSTVTTGSTLQRTATVLQYLAAGWPMTETAKGESSNMKPKP